MSQTSVYTIGYGAREISEFIALLLFYDIKYLLDVRSKPYSRYKPDFSKDVLERSLLRFGIRYVFMGDSLGGRPDDLDCYDAEGKVLYNQIADKDFFQRGVERVHRALEQELSVVLMCSEGKPEICHRSKLIGKVLAAEGVQVCHIDENNRIISQQDIQLRLNQGQLSLFGDEFFEHTSRKRYNPQDEDGE
ncbi:MAG: DUF488 domain-containing protein [Candidatus Promineifilaceae bacterium]|nr:DUF488 domain-containing protein [Candidatus Promineifilaceae bacterium]